MKRIARIAVAASLLVALGIAVSWLVIAGGERNMAFARVAEALERLRSATYEWSTKPPKDIGDWFHPAKGKGFFLAPSHERTEASLDIFEAMSKAARRKHGDNVLVTAHGESKLTNVTIADGAATKALMLQPSLKTAIVMSLKELPKGSRVGAGPLPPDMFEMVRQIVREGNTGNGEKVERLGMKETDGRKAVGFLVHSAMGGLGDLTFWADPETARPIRIEIARRDEFYAVMSNFRYDVDLDPTLFSLELPSGYSTRTINLTLSSEKDLLQALRTITEHNKGMFPAKLGLNKEVLEVLMPPAGELVVNMDKATEAKLNAAMNKIGAKHGGWDKLRAKYGDQLPPEIMAEITKTAESIVPEDKRRLVPQKEKELDDKKWKMKAIEPDDMTGKVVAEVEMDGICFYENLEPGNDPHYAGGGVKLGTPNKAILWYKPDGAKKYRVIYADLSVKEMTAEEVKKLAK